MNDNPAIKGLIELIEKRYGLEVLDSHYVLVDEKYDAVCQITKTDA